MTSRASLVVFFSCLAGAGPLFSAEGPPDKVLFKLQVDPSGAVVASLPQGPEPFLVKGAIVPVEVSCGDKVDCGKVEGSFAGKPLVWEASASSSRKAKITLSPDSQELGLSYDTKAVWKRAVKRSPLPPEHSAPSPNAALGTASPPIAMIRAALTLGLVYWLGMVVVRWNRVARPTRELLKAQINYLRAQLTTLPEAPEKAAITELLDAAGTLVDETKTSRRGRLADYLFWSRGQELTGWGYCHEAEIRMVALLPKETMIARLEASERRLRIANEAMSLDLANSIEQAIKNRTEINLGRCRALLAEAFSTNYQRDDNYYADSVSWQNKTSWLVVCGLILIVALTVAFPSQGIFFLIGGTGGLLSRMSRSLDRKDVPTDYGASWTTLFLSPVTGALGAWAGILIAGLAADGHVLGEAFKTDWSDPGSPRTLGIALVFGFSERLLDSVLDKLTGKAIAEPEGATKPPLRLKDEPPVPDGAGLRVDTHLAEAQVGQSYRSRLKAVNGTGEVRWRLKTGPVNFSLDAEGNLKGMPTEDQEGVLKLLVEATDARGSATAELTLMVHKAD